MAVSYSERVKFGSDHIIDRLGASIRYYRFKDQAWDPDVGPVKTWWESPTFNALVVTVTSEEIRDGGGVISMGDRSLLFKISEFTDQTEQITNGTFTGDASGWDVSGTVAYGTNNIIFTGDSTNDNILGQTSIWEDNARDDELIRLSYEVISNSLEGASELRIGVQSVDEIFTSQYIETSVGTHAITANVRYTGTGNKLYMFITDNCTGGTITLDNISIGFQAGDDPVCPVAGDEIVYGGNTYEADLGGNEVIYEADVSGTLFLVYARRKI